MAVVFNHYGARRLRKISWTAEIIARRNCYDYRQRESWTSVGVPADARLVDVRIERSSGLMRRPEIVFVYEHPTWDELAPGLLIPEHTVLFVNIRSAMDLLGLSPGANDDLSPGAPV